MVFLITIQMERLSSIFLQNEIMTIAVCKHQHDRCHQDDKAQEHDRCHQDDKAQARTLMRAIDYEKLYLSCICHDMLTVVPVEMDSRIYKHGIFPYRYFG